jgi:hypothetical protein
VTTVAETADVGHCGAVPIDDALAESWTYDKLHDAFVKDGEFVMVKLVWRALVEERSA